MAKNLVEITCAVQSSLAFTGSHLGPLELSSLSLLSQKRLSWTNIITELLFLLNHPSQDIQPHIQDKTDKPLPSRFVCLIHAQTHTHLFSNMEINNTGITETWFCSVRDVTSGVRFVRLYCTQIWLVIRLLLDDSKQPNKSLPVTI